MWPARWAIPLRRAALRPMGYQNDPSRPWSANMNGADQVSPGVIHVEAPTSALPTGGRYAIGIKAKLFLAFGAMAMLTAGASAVAWYAFTNVERSVAWITADSIVGMAASLR